jgi:ABC-type multidrug transport system fused ATPase/permease subunit
VETELTAATVLSALATFRILQEPIYNLLELISIISQTKVSVDRIQEFLQEEDQNQFMNKHVSKTSRIVIEVKPGELPKFMSQTMRCTLNRNSTGYQMEVLKPASAKGQKMCMRNLKCKTLWQWQLAVEDWPLK